MSTSLMDIRSKDSARVFFIFPPGLGLGLVRPIMVWARPMGPTFVFSFLFFFFLQQNLYTKTLPFFWFSVGKFQSSVAQQSLSFHSVSCITGYLSETHWRAELSLSLSPSLQKQQQLNWDQRGIALTHWGCIIKCSPRCTPTVWWYVSKKHVGYCFLFHYCF